MGGRRQWLGGGQQHLGMLGREGEGGGGIEGAKSWRWMLLPLTLLLPLLLHSRLTLLLQLLPSLLFPPLLLPLLLL